MPACDAHGLIVRELKARVAADPLPKPSLRVAESDFTPPRDYVIYLNSEPMQLGSGARKPDNEVMAKRRRA